MPKKKTRSGSISEHGLGPFAAAAGITEERLLTDELDRVEHLQNGVIFNIYKYVLDKARVKRAVPDSVWAGWVRRIGGIPIAYSSGDIVKHVRDLHSERSDLNRLRRDSEKLCLDQALFTMSTTGTSSGCSANNTTDEGGAADLLADEIRRMEAHFSVMEQEATRLKEEVGAKKTEAGVLSERCDRGQAELASLSAQLDQRRLALGAVNAELEDRETQVHSINEELQRKNTQLDKARADLDVVALQSENVKQELKQNREEAARINDANKENKVKYKPRNVREREARHAKKVASMNEMLNKSMDAMDVITQEEIQRKETVIEEKQARNELLEKENQDARDEIKRLRNQKSYYKVLYEKIVKEKNETKEKLTAEVEFLNARIAAEDFKDVKPVDGDGVFSVSTRRCVLELVALEVPTDKVNPVIRSVAKHLFGFEFAENMLPKRQSVLNISDEGQYLVKQMYSEEIQKAKHFGVHKDGTSRKKKKILENSLTLDNKRVLPLGFRHVADETAKTITATTQNELAEVSTCGGTLVSEIVRKLTFLMTDRAANEKLSNAQIQAWKNDLLGISGNTDEAEIVHSFHCMIHVLLGFHTYGTKNLMELQKSVENEGTKLGRDNAIRYRPELAAARCVRMASELLGPIPDERSGRREEWLAHCRTIHVKSTIGNYRDNRFNCLFENSAQILLHAKDIVNFISGLSTDNNKVRSVALDLQDAKVLTMIQSIALCYFKITGPYWDVMNSGDCNYLSLHPYIKKMYASIKAWNEDPLSLLAKDDAPIFDDFPGDRTSAMFVVAAQKPVDEPFFKDCVKAIMKGMETCCINQLSDFLTGKFSGTPDPAVAALVAGAPLNNMQSERNFAFLDSSQQKRRRATFHYHTSILLLKQNRKQLQDWLDNMQEDVVAKLFQKARSGGKELRRSHQQFEKQTAKNQEEKLALEVEKKKKREERKARAASGAPKPAVRLRNTIQTTTDEDDDVSSDSESDFDDDVDRNGNEIPDGTDISVNDWVAVAYEDGWFLGSVTSLTEEDADGDPACIVEFLKQTSIRGQYKKSSNPEVCEEKREFIFAGPLQPPVPCSGGRQYTLPDADVIALKFQDFAKRMNWKIK